MGSTQERALQLIQEIASTTDGSQEILRLDSKMILTETSDLLLYKRAIRRIDGSQGTPVVFKVLLLACLQSQLQIDGTLLRQQSCIRPGCTIKDRRGIASSGHGTKVAIEFLMCHILGLIDLQQKISGRDNHVAIGSSGKEHNARPHMVAQQ